MAEKKSVIPNYNQNQTLRIDFRRINNYLFVIYDSLIDFDNKKKKKPTEALGKIPALPISNGQSASPEVLV